MFYVCKLEYCPENVRFTDILNATEICVISVEISFGKPFGNLCSEKHRFADDYAATLAFILSITFFIPIQTDISENISTILLLSVNGASWRTDIFSFPCYRKLFLAVYTEVLVGSYKKSHSVAGEINVPADFYTIEKAFSGVKTAEKGIK